MESKPLKIFVIFGEHKIEVNCNTDNTFTDVKYLISTITGVPAFRQNVINPNVTDTTEGRTLRELGLRNGAQLYMTDITCEPLPQSRSDHDDFDDDDDGNDNRDAELRAGTSSLYPLPTAQLKREFKAVGMPREGKKLAVFEIDKTIFDAEARSKSHVARPFLQELMSRIYEHYDIGIWSATDMRVTEHRIGLLGMNSHPDYKLLFYMDLYAMGWVHLDNRRCLVKPLSKVWDKYPQYNNTNTVIIDDKPRTFFLNPKNGIPVTPYSHALRKTDDDLLQLLYYLQSIAEAANLTVFNHRDWKRQIMGGSSSSSTSSTSYASYGNP